MAENKIESKKNGHEWYSEFIEDYREMNMQSKITD